MIRRADTLMYEVKRAGKDAARFATDGADVIDGALPGGSGPLQ